MRRTRSVGGTKVVHGTRDGLASRWGSVARQAGGCASRLLDRKGARFSRARLGEKTTNLHNSARRSQQLIGSDESRFYIHRNGLQLFERLLDRWPDDAQPIAERFRPRIVALGLNRHDLAGQTRHTLLDSIGVDGEGSVRLDREGALIEKVVQLNRDPFSVRLAHAEADRAEGGCQKCRVERLLHLFWQHALVDHVLNGEEAGDVGLGLLERAVGVLQLLPHGRLPAAGVDAVRPEPVHQLVDDDVREEGFEGEPPLIGAVEHDARDRLQRFGELRVLDVLQHDAFGALFLHDALVVWQVERRRPHGTVAAAARLVRNFASVGSVVICAASRRSDAARSSSGWYSTLYGTSVKLAPERRTTVKKPVARARSASGSACIHLSRSAFAAPSG